jgi:hypothetical protein
MVDAFQNNIKKIRIKPESLPPIIVTTDGTTLGQYYFRYRIVSEDGTRKSAYSPVQAVNARDFSSVTVNLNTVSDGTKFILSWTIPDVYMTQYDIYVAWSSNSGSTYTSYSYIGRSTGNSFVIDIPAIYQSELGTKMAKFIIQLPTSPQVLNTKAEIYESSVGVSTQITPVDGGTV